MTRDRTVTIRIPEPLLAATLRAARAEETTAGDFIRAALVDRLARVGGGERDAVDAIRSALRRDFAEAGDWVALQCRLRAQKLVLRQRDGELWLMTWPVERRLVPLARLGVAEAELTLVYRAPFPAFGGGAAPKARLSPVALFTRRRAA